MKHLILAAARRPKFIFADTDPWAGVDTSFSAFVRGIGANADRVTEVADLSPEQKVMISDMTLLGNALADTEGDLIALPVIDPMFPAFLNLDALRGVAEMTPESSDIPASSLDSAKTMAMSLLESEVPRGASRTAGATTDGESGSSHLDEGSSHLHPKRNSQRVAINSRTTGIVRERNINGRRHLVTKMVSIVGDTVMNRILYPLEEVSKSFRQLDNLPSPAGHPTVDGRQVSARDPLGINAHHIGAFIKNPRMEGAQVINDFLIDVQTADSTEQGREVREHVENRLPLDVSTGLHLHLENASGTAPDGNHFDQIGKDYQFDHVAVLLNEAAAGAHAGTKLVYNENQERVLVCNVAGLETQKEDETKEQIMTNAEMLAALPSKEMRAHLEAEGDTILASNDARLPKLDIPDDEFEAFNEYKEDKAKALNTLREKAAGVLKLNADELADATEVALNRIVANAEEAKAKEDATNADKDGKDDAQNADKGDGKKSANNSLRAGGGGVSDSSNEVTGESLKAQHEAINAEKEK